MKNFTAEELNKVLAKHHDWITSHGTEGTCADLKNADLKNADLRGADLRDADLRYADLRGADFKDADLRGADLFGAVLVGAVLVGADLRGANIDNFILNRIVPLTCPSSGSFIAWKKAAHMIVKLKVCDDAERSSSTGRKCRCSAAKVLAIENIDGTNSGLTQVSSNFDPDFVYKIGKIVSVPNFDKDRKNECAPGIHFFITREEARCYRY